MTALPRPLLARHPIKALYVTYVLTVLGLIKIPFWILKFSIPAFRQNPRWPFIRALAVAVLRRVSELIARTHLYYATRDPSRLIENTPKNIAHAVWVRPVERELIKGQMDRWMRDTGVIQVRIPGYWYGKGRDQPKIRAAPGEKVLYHVHG